MVDYRKAGSATIIGIISIAIVVGVTEAINLSGLTQTIVVFVPVALAAKLIYDAFA
jgi:hypothetical protein